MTRFEAKAVIAKLDRMFKGRHFCICDVDSLMDVTGATRTSDYKALRLYHCVDYADMDKETKQFVYKAAMENVCNVAAFPEVRLYDPSEETAKALELASGTAIQRLLGRFSARSR